MKEIGEVRFARVQGLALRVALEHECSCIEISVVYVSLSLMRVRLKPLLGCPHYHRKLT